MALSNDAVTALSNHIHTEAKQWVEEYIANRKRVLTSRKITASGDLVNSMQYALTQVVNAAVTNTLELAFQEHGRYVDMKRLNVPDGGEEYIKELIGWIEQKGLYEKFIQKYISNRRLKTEPKRETALTGMAWAIVRKRQTKFRRRAWYAKSSQGAINDLYNRIAAGIPDIVMDELKQAFGHQN